MGVKQNLSATPRLFLSSSKRGCVRGLVRIFATLSNLWIWQTECLVDDPFTDNKEIKVHMFCSEVQHEVTRPGDSAEIVTINDWMTDSNLHLLKQRLNPLHFRGCSSQASLLCLCAWSSNRMLLSGLPWHQIHPKINTWTRSWFSVIEINHPISITEGL